MRKSEYLRSEDDARTKIVYQWLEEHGFSPTEVSVEHSISIRAGRSKLRAEAGKLVNTSLPERRQGITPRADVLVRGEGKNLLVIEVKAPGEPLDDEARDQGCFYARALLDGNIAPVVVLTDGTNSRLFDSITKEELTDSTVTRDFVNTRAEFRASADDLKLRAEALEAIISLSPSNLNAFCGAQACYRMEVLRSSDPLAGRKYVPGLYIERRDAKAELLDLLGQQNRPVSVLVGPPQVGKTNLVCRLVEERLAAGEPTLFYPAVKVRRSLLEEIADDFEEAFGHMSSPAQLLKRLRRVLRRAGKKLVVFVDGWNEADIHLARIIDEESERLSSDDIQIVISMTSMAANRLLSGNAGNPSFIARAASIEAQSAQLLSVEPNIDPKTMDWSVVMLGNYSAEETEHAYKRYASAYHVVVPPTHRKTSEPYILGIAMLLYRNSALPDKLDEPELMQKFIREKINRAVGLEAYEPQVLLGELGREMYEHDAPVSKGTASALCGLPIVSRLPQGLFDAGLLTERTGPSGEDAVDFYYGRDRDFVISYWAQRWPFKLRDCLDITLEFNHAMLTNAGTEALRWFFKQPVHIESLEATTGALPQFENPAVKQTLFSSLCDIVGRGIEDGERWLGYAVDRATNDPDLLVRIEAVKLIALTSENEEDITGAIDDSNIEDFVEALLAIGDEFSLEVGSVGQVVLDALRSIHHDWSGGETFDGTRITGVLEDLMDDESESVRRAAAACLGYADGHVFLKSIADRVNAGTLLPGDSELDEYREGLHTAISVLGEVYYGSYCPGYMEVLNREHDLKDEEYEQIAPVLDTVIALYDGDGRVKRLKDLLDDLTPESDDGYSRPSRDLRTRELPFDGK